MFKFRYSKKICSNSKMQKFSTEGFPGIVVKQRSVYQMPGYLFTKALRVIMQKCRLFSSQYYLPSFSRLAGCRILKVTQHHHLLPPLPPSKVIILLVFSLLIKASAEKKYSQDSLLVIQAFCIRIEQYLAEADHQSFAVQSI